MIWQLLLTIYSIDCRHPRGLPRLKKGTGANHTNKLPAKLEGQAEHPAHREGPHSLRFLRSQAIGSRFAIRDCGEGADEKANDRHQAKNASEYDDHCTFPFIAFLRAFPSHLRHHLVLRQQNLIGASVVVCGGRKDLIVCRVRVWCYETQRGGVLALH